MEGQQGQGYLGRPAASSLAQVVEIVLDKGIVIDAYARVSVLGIEVLTLDARVVVSSVDTYLRFAEATNRLELEDKGGTTLPELLSEETEEAVTSIADHVVEDKVEGALDKVGDAVGEPVERAARATARKAVDVAERVAKKI
jgi:hypothetical protein